MLTHVWYNLLNSLPTLLLLFCHEVRGWPHYCSSLETGELTEGSATRELGYFHRTYFQNCLLMHTPSLKRSGEVRRVVAKLSLQCKFKKWVWKVNRWIHKVPKTEKLSGKKSLLKLFGKERPNLFGHWTICLSNQICGLILKLPVDKRGSIGHWMMGSQLAAVLPMAVGFFLSPWLIFVLREKLCFLVNSSLNNAAWF